MSETDIRHMHEDLELIKQDIAIIKHILTEEGELTPEAKERLAQARKTHLDKYVKL